MRSLCAFCAKRLTATTGTGRPMRRRRGSHIQTDDGISGSYTRMSGSCIFTIVCQSLATTTLNVHSHGTRMRVRHRTLHSWVAPRVKCNIRSDIIVITRSSTTTLCIAISPTATGRCDPAVKPTNNSTDAAHVKMQSHCSTSELALS